MIPRPITFDTPSHTRILPREGAMAKTRGQDDDTGDLPDERPGEGNGDQGQRKPGGRTIARCKALAHKDVPQGSDEEVAACISLVAEQEGYDYVCSAAQVAKWRENDTWPPATPAPESAP